MPRKLCHKPRPGRLPSRCTPPRTLSTPTPRGADLPSEQTWNEWRSGWQLGSVLSRRAPSTSRKGDYGSPFPLGPKPRRLNHPQNASDTPYTRPDTPNTSQHLSTHTHPHPRLGLPAEARTAASAERHTSCARPARWRLGFRA